MSFEELCFRHYLPLKLIDLKNSVFILMCEKCQRETTEKISIDELLQQLKIVVSNQSAIYKEQHKQYLTQFTEMKKQIKIQINQLNECDILINKILNLIPQNQSYFEGLQIQIESCKKQFNLYDFEHLMTKVSYNDDTRELYLNENFEKIFNIQENLSSLGDEITFQKKTNRKFQKFITLLVNKQQNEQRIIKLKEDQNIQKDNQKDDQDFQWNEVPYFEPIEECWMQPEKFMMARTQHLVLCYNLNTCSFIQCKNPKNIQINDKITSFSSYLVEQQVYILLAMDNGFIEKWLLRKNKMIFVQAVKVCDKRGDIKIHKRGQNDMLLIGGDRIFKIIELNNLQIIYQHPLILLNSIPKIFQLQDIELYQTYRILISGNEIVYLTDQQIITNLAQILEFFVSYLTVLHSFINSKLLKTLIQPTIQWKQLFITRKYNQLQNQIWVFNQLRGLRLWDFNLYKGYSLYICVIGESIQYDLFISEMDTIAK